jgi:hypothetical protein
VLGETPQPNGTILRQAREFTNRPFRRFGPVFDLEPDGNGGAPARMPRAGAAGRAETTSGPRMISQNERQPKEPPRCPNRCPPCA